MGKEIMKKKIPELRTEDLMVSTIKKERKKDQHLCEISKQHQEQTEDTKSL